MGQSFILVAAVGAVLALDVGQALSQSQASTAVGGGSGSATVVPLDSEASMRGLQVACTGVGQSKDDPKWRAYPVRVEFSNPSGAFLANGAVSIATAGGKSLASVSCEGPWILLRPTSGRGAFRVTGWLPGQGYKAVSQSFTIPAGGQQVIDLRFAEP